MPSGGWRNQETQANTSDLPPIGGFNHTLSIFSVYPRRDPYPPGNTQGYAVWRHDDAVLRGAVGAEDDGTRVVHNSITTNLSFAINVCRAIVPAYFRLLLLL